MERQDSRRASADLSCERTLSVAKATLPTLLFGLNLAIALPPDAIVAPADAARPVIHTLSQPIVEAGELEAVLHRPTVSVGMGRVALGEVDTRLHGLVVRLQAFRVVDGSPALITVGMVTPEVRPGGERHATVRDLWRLTAGAIAERGIPYERLVGLGDDGFQSLPGPSTAQVAWRTGEGLATVSLTSLDGDTHALLGRARAIAARVHDLLLLDESRAPLTSEEMVVAALAASGRTTVQIARALAVSERATAWYVSSLTTRLGLSTRAQLTRWACQQRPRAAEVA